MLKKKSVPEDDIDSLEMAIWMDDYWVKTLEQMLIAYPDDERVPEWKSMRRKWSKNLKKNCKLLKRKVETC